MTAAQLRLGELHNLVLPHLANAVLVVKQAFCLVEESVYEDNENDMESESLHRLRELTNEHTKRTVEIPFSIKWEFKHVSVIADVPVIRDALTTISAAANPSYKSPSAAAGPAKCKSRPCVNYFLDRPCAHYFQNKCKYAHAREELAPDCTKAWDSYKTSMCNKGPSCLHGDTCLYAHNDDEKRHAAAVRIKAMGDDWVAFRNDFICHSEGEATTSHIAYMCAASEHVKHAATDARAACNALRYFRNVLAHLPGSVLKNGISEESYDFVRKTIAAAGSCLAAMLASKPTVFQCTARKFNPGAVAFTPAAAAAAFTPAAVPVQSTISTLTVDEVVHLFEKHKFPTEGIKENGIDGASLTLLCVDSDHQAMICAPSPDGLGFPPILYKGRFRWEMHKLGVKFNPAYVPKVLPEHT